MGLYIIWATYVEEFVAIYRKLDFNIFLGVN